MFMMFGLLIAVSSAASAADASYTAAQATTGKGVYVQHCEQCHGAQLQGGAGPALKGASLLHGYPTASALHDFIKTQMPADAPDSLSSAQYAAVTAFLLKQNGRLGGGTAKGSPSTNEIERAAVPSTKSFAAVPATADVAIDDARMKDAASDSK